MLVLNLISQIILESSVFQLVRVVKQIWVFKWLESGIKHGFGNLCF